MSYADLLADPDLLFYLPLDDTGTTTDVVNKRGSNGTLTGGDTCDVLADAAPPRGTGSLDLDGTADYVALDQTYTCEDNWTFCCWMRPDELGVVRQPLIGAGSTQFVECYANDIIVRFAGPVANSGNITGRVSTDEWAHVAVVRNSDDSTTFYINGRFFSTDSVNLLTNNAAFSQIGQRATNYFNGNLAEAMLFDRALSADEVLTIFVSTLQPGYDEFTLTNPSDTVTDFSLMLDLSECSTDWWDRVTSTDGTKLRAFKADGTRLAVDVIDFDYPNRTGWARVLWSGSLTNTGTYKLRVEPPRAGNAVVLASDTYGSDFAYDTYTEAYWPDGGATDRSSNGYDGTAVGDPVTANGETTFDGDDAFSTSFTANPTNFSYGGWAKFDNSHGTILAKGEANADDTILYDETGSVDFRMGNVKVAECPARSTYPQGADGWAHYVATKSGNDFKLYLDGVLSDSNTVTGKTLSNTHGWSYGAREDATARFHTGKLKHLFVHYEVARSAAWVAYEHDQTNDSAAFWDTPTFTPETLGPHDEISIDTLPASELTDFSLVFDLANMSSSWWASVDTSDATRGRVYYDDGTTTVRVPVHWIDFDNVTETGLVRVNIPALPTTGSPSLKIEPPRIGNLPVSADDEYGSDNAYDQYWEGYWTNGSLSDRTANGMDLTASGSATTSSTGGLFGGCLSLPGGYYYHTATTPVTAPPFTMMGWGNVDSTAVNDDCTVACLGTDTGVLPVYRYSLYRDTSAGTWNSRLLAFDDASNYSDADMPSALTEEWHHFAGVVASSTSRTPYFDGAAGTEDTPSNTPTDIDTFLVGRGNGDFTGELDEVQLHSIARSADWIDYEYTQVNDPATTFGTPTWSLGDHDEISFATLPSSELNGFSVILDLSLMSSDWWTTAEDTDATRGRVYYDSGTTAVRVAVDWMDYDHANQTGFLRALIPTIPSSGTPKLYVEPPTSSYPTVAATDAYGQYAAYDANWVVYYPLTDLNDRTASEAHLSVDTGTGATPLAAGKVGGCYDANNGGDVDRLTATLPNTLDTPCTFSCWVQHDTPNYTQLSGGVYTSDGTEGIGIGRYSHDPVRTLIGSSGVFTGTGGEDLPDNNSIWSLITARYTDTTAEPIKNGNTGFIVENHAKNPANLDLLYLFGGYTTSNWHRGRIDDFQIHRIDRSDAWITYEYDQTNNQATFWGTPTWSGAGGNEALTVNPAVVNVTGQSVGMTAGRVLTVNPATINATGQQVTMLRGRSLAVEPAVVHLSGQAVDLTYTPNVGGEYEPLTVNPATVNVIGQAVSLLRGRVLAVSPAVVNLAGQAVELRHGRKLAVEPATVNATGQAVGMLHNRRLATSPAVVNVSGKLVTLTYSNEELPTLTGVRLKTINGVPTVKTITRPVQVHTVPSEQ